MEGVAEDCGEIVYINVNLENDYIKKISITGENLSEITKKVIKKMKTFEGKQTNEIRNVDEEELLAMLGFTDLSEGKKSFAVLPIKALKRALENHKKV